MARVLIEGLLTERQRPLFQNHDIKMHLDRHHGNMRDLLFGLYDWYEAGDLNHAVARKATWLA
jgi:hypothetical protein